jgi:CcmD family protein
MDERNVAYMFYGFSAAWILVVGYVISLVLRERKIRAEMERLRRMVEGEKR